MLLAMLNEIHYKNVPLSGMGKMAQPLPSPTLSTTSKTSYCIVFEGSQWVVEVVVEVADVLDQWWMPSCPVKLKHTPHKCLNKSLWKFKFEKILNFKIEMYLEIVCVRRDCGCSVAVVCIRTWNHKLIDSHCSFRLTFSIIWWKPRKRGMDRKVWFSSDSWYNFFMVLTLFVFSTALTNVFSSWWFVWAAVPPSFTYTVFKPQSWC